jgi:hypothetical protein
VAVRPKRQKQRPKQAPKRERGPSAWTLGAQHRPTALRAATTRELAQLEADRGAWLLELAWEGHRVTACRLEDEVRLYADDLRDWTQHATAIALTLSELKVSELVIEGFLCVLDAQGRPDFSALKARIEAGSGAPPVLVAWGPAARRRRRSARAAVAGAKRAPAPVAAEAEPCGALGRPRRPATGTRSPSSRVRSGERAAPVDQQPGPARVRRPAAARRAPLRHWYLVGLTALNKSEGHRRESASRRP